MKYLDDEFYLLVKFDGNYADEFDMEGFTVFSLSEWYWHCWKILGDATFPQECYFGTNEFFEFESAEDYLRNFSLKLITKAEAETLYKLFNGHYGEIPDLDYNEDA